MSCTGTSTSAVLHDLQRYRPRLGVAVENAGRTTDRPSATWLVPTVVRA